MQRMHEELSAVHACECIGVPVYGALTSAAWELYLSLISVNLSTEYLLKKLLRVSFPPSCIFLS